MSFGLFPRACVWIALLNVAFHASFAVSCPAPLRQVTPPSAFLQLPKVQEGLGWGPHVHLSASVNTRPLEQISQLSFAQYNLQDFSEAIAGNARSEGDRFAFDPSKGEKLMYSHDYGKELHKVTGIAKNLLQANPDFVVLQEVQSLDVLQQMNEYYFHGNYKTILIPGNDQYGKNIAFMVKKDLPFDIEVQSYRNVARKGRNYPLFSRDTPMMLVRPKGAASGSKPLFGLMAVHFKSQGEEAMHEINTEIRAREVEGTAKILKYYQRKFGPEVPFFVGGDFNNDISAPEFEPLADWAGFQDAFDLAPPQNAPAWQDRVTHTFHPLIPTANGMLEGEAEGLHMDTFAGSPVVERDGLVQKMNIRANRDENGASIPRPQSYAERQKSPTDHMMVHMFVDFQKILKLFYQSAH